MDDDNDDSFQLVETKKKNNFKLKLKNENKINNTLNKYKEVIHNDKEIIHNDKKENKILNQEEMKNILISKFNSFNNVEINTKEMNKDKGLFYSINVKTNLYNIDNGIFHNAKLNTVSHVNRIVYIKLVFTDNEILHNDMKINIDSIIQCFREIMPDTIITIKLETFKDQLENEHLTLIVSTIKGSSLTYVYKKMLEFVSVINKKYGNLQYEPKHKLHNQKSLENSVEPSLENPVDTSIETSIENPVVNPIENPIEKLVEKPVENSVETPVKKPITNIVVETTEKQIINDSILIIIENLKKEEKKLLLELNNVKRLLNSQNYLLSKLNNNEIKENLQNKIDNETINKNSFSYKVTHGIN
jgi:hypothetical protein